MKIPTNILIIALSIHYLAAIEFRAYRSEVSQSSGEDGKDFQDSLKKTKEKSRPEDKQ